MMNGSTAPTALLVIDVQQGFDDASWGPRNNPAAEDNIARLLHGFRQANRPVLHVFHDSLLPTSPLRRRTAGNDPKPLAMPRTGEAIYRKSVNSAFIGTALEADLRREGITALVIVGLTTNHCVSTMTRMAGNLGFDSYVVEDATATFDRAALDGGIRPAAEVHRSALSDLHGEFATVITTDEVLAFLRVS